MAYSGNFNDLIGSLSALKRRAQLTGKNITDADVMNIQEPFFTAAREYAPTQAALDEQKRQAEEQLRLQEDIAAENRNAGLIQSGVNAVGTGLTAYNLLKGSPQQSGQLLEDGLTMSNSGAEPGTLTSAGTKIKDFTKGAIDKYFGSSTPAAADTLNTSAVSEAAGGAIGAETVTPTVLEDGVTLAEGTSSAGAAAGTAGGATIGSIVGYAAPYWAAAKIGMPILGNIMGQGFEDAFGIDPDSSNVLAGMNRAVGRGIEGAVTPVLNEVFNVEVPEVAQAVINPAGYLSSKCIIVTACTDRNSYEVDITRQYRDKFLDADQKRGYYCIAEKIVPLLEKNEQARKLCKKWLVDRLIDYGAHRINLKHTPPRLPSIIVSKAFLGLIKVIGFIIPVYVRKNGEVY